MSERGRRAPRLWPQPPVPLTTTASVDTVELFLRRPPRGLRRRVERVTGRRVQIEDSIDGTGYRRGVRVIVNRPTLSSLAVLADIRRTEPGSATSRVDIAFDFELNVEDEADSLSDWIDHHVVLKWRSKRTRKMEYEGTMYWCDARKGRNLARYRKRRQRGRVVRLELRFYRAATVTRAGLSDIAALPSINPRPLFNRHVKAMRFTERCKIRAMREAVAHERKRAATRSDRRRSKKVQRLLDRYRSRIPQRVRWLLEQIDAQSMGRRGTENVKLDFLSIPDHVTWPPLKSQGYSGKGAGVGGYYD